MDYSTLSPKGVTRLLNGKEAEFTELNQWIKDFKHFQELIKIKTFAKFRMWKAFSVWRKNVRWRLCIYYTYNYCDDEGSVLMLMQENGAV